MEEGGFTVGDCRNSKLDEGRNGESYPGSTELWENIQRQRRPKSWGMGLLGCVELGRHGGRVLVGVSANCYQRLQFGQGRLKSPNRSCWHSLALSAVRALRTETKFDSVAATRCGDRRRAAARGPFQRRWLRSIGRLLPSRRPLRPGSPWGRHAQGSAGSGCLGVAILPK
ncbi:MAG: hypothetical protein ACI9EF_000134 [Pseudohongiellaceae bacterium]|jgi:hypothetical protein